ncbi:TnsA endonuclease N-terminal domain-containing protein [Photobacterium leiognathi]|uniref:TnsA endonuclease N-terminal domain-containing protein n=1 Tax=Photobacterium leiognathi TaxID=553611 RepID=UPI000D16D308|nr:TnsA endonuclease N-terminal domain-containing protein [Photobacterium leiognathi]PSW58050.1 hypothetical protein C0W50_04695 [Photobacterium leiognathi subsp. mandapamensis]
MYVRNLRKSSPVKKVYKFASLKNQSVIMCESTLEQDCCYHLEYFKKVIAYQSQPEGFYYFLGNKHYPYTPDFLVRNKDGSEYFIEVKPLNKTFSEDFKNKFASKRNAAKKLGKPLLLVTDRQIRKGLFLDNLKLIHRYSGLMDSNESLSLVINELRTIGPMCIRSLANNLKLSVGEVIAIVFCLIGLDKVNASLDTVINEMSVISVN